MTNTTPMHTTTTTTTTTTAARTEGATMSTQTTDPSTAWLGEYVGELTAKQIDQLNFLRSSMQPGPGFSEDVDRVLLGDAAGEVEHNRLQASMAGVPLPSWAPDAGTGWELWNDGKLRRGHDLGTWPSILSTLDTSGSFDVFVGGCEVQDAPPEIYIDVMAENVPLDTGTGPAGRTATARRGQQDGSGTGQLSAR